VDPIHDLNQSFQLKEPKKEEEKTPKRLANERGRRRRIVASIIHAFTH
jgi:hypothetical protein